MTIFACVVILYTIRFLTDEKDGYMTRKNNRPEEIRANNKENKKNRKRTDGRMRNLSEALYLELREHKSSFIVYFTLRILVIVMLILQLLNRNYENVFLCALTMLLLIMPSLVQVTFKVELPTTLEIFILVFIFAAEILGEIRETVGITAAAGIGTNLYLCKIALDIQAKHVSPDASGSRIALLDESSYRRELWDHRPITDFWRVGSGYAGKLARCGLYTMGDIARCSLGGPRDYHNEDLLYRLFGVNAELLIDHAWGWEPCTMADIKAYRPEAGSIGSGQVLHCPYPASRARLVLREMADALSMDLVRQSLSTDQLVLTVGYDIENLRGRRRQDYRGEITTDRYGRPVPRHARGTENLDRYTSSSRQILEAATALFDRITDPSLLVRRLTLTACHVLPEDAAAGREQYRQLNLFTDYPPRGQPGEEGDSASVREKNWQKALLQIRRKYGKNAVLRGMSLQEGATARDRNRQIGGHRA